jgi:hypothetical protein
MMAVSVMARLQIAAHRNQDGPEARATTGRFSNAPSISEFQLREARAIVRQRTQPATPFRVGGGSWQRRLSLMGYSDAPRPSRHSNAVGAAKQVQPVEDGAMHSVAHSLALPGRAWLWFSAGFLMLAAAFLVGPRVPAALQEQKCVGNIELAGPFGFSLNCDSPEFMWLARDPAGLLAPESPRQARPGLIFAAALLERGLSLIVPSAAPPAPIGQGLFDPSRIVQAYHENFSAYLAYVLLNFAIVLTAFWLLRRMVREGAPHAAADVASDVILVSTGLLLVANGVAKAFLWSPHTQMFNILAPVLALYAAWRTFEGALGKIGFALAIGTATGFGILAYPVFVVVPAAMALPALLASREQKTRTLPHLAFVLLLASIPSIAWYVFVRATTGTFFHFEMAQGEVVWMADAWRQGWSTFAHEWFTKLGLLLSLAAPQAGPTLVVTLLFIAVMWRTRPRAVWSILAAGFLASAAVLGFYTCVGWTAERLAYAMLPPLIAALGTAAAIGAARLGAPHRHRVAGAFALVAAAQMIYIVVKDGPWS